MHWQVCHTWKNFLVAFVWSSSLLPFTFILKNIVFDGVWQSIYAPPNPWALWKLIQVVSYFHLKLWDLLIFTHLVSVENIDSLWLFVYSTYQVVNKLMYSCSADHLVKCWVVEFGDCTRTYKGHKHSVSQLHFQDGLRKLKQCSHKVNRGLLYIILFCRADFLKGSKSVWESWRFKSQYRAWKIFEFHLARGQVTLKFCLPGTLSRLPKLSKLLIIHEPKNGSHTTGVF